MYKLIFIVLSMAFNSYALGQPESQSQDKEWKDFKVQSESKKPQTSPDRTATSSNPYLFQSYQSIALPVNGQVKNCVINNNGYVVRCN